MIEKNIRRMTWVICLVFFSAPLFLAGQSDVLLKRPEQFERSRDFDAIHYRLNFVFNEAEKSYIGENTVTLSSLKDNLQTCVLDAEDLTVTSVSDPQGSDLSFRHEEGEVKIDLAKPARYGETVTFTIRFTHQNPKRGLKFIDATPDYPAQINTYNWPEEARRWFPCYDFPNDKVTNEVIATVRSGSKVLSNGRLAEMVEDPAAGTVTYHWIQDKPHPTYCIMLAAGPYEVIEDSLGELPVNYWVYEKDVAKAPLSFRKTPRMIEFFSKTFAFPYPWAKYDQVCVAGSGGGLEATTATILGHGTIHDERADQDFSSEGLVAHELAHMWWGDMITPRTWSEVWLSESFATYSEYLWSRHDRGEDEGALNLEQKKASYISEAKNRYIRPIVFNRYNSPWNVMDSHSYPKGAVVLHMLRFVMGDGPFFRSLSRFLETHAFQSVDTHDFAAVIKETTGENLDWFFDQWVYKPGHPVFEVGWKWAEATKKVLLEVRQIQDLTKGTPVFRTPVLIGIRSAEGNVTKKIWISREEETFEIDAQVKPRLVRFDEGNHLLKEMVFPKSREELSIQVRKDDAIGRIWAAQQLLKFVQNEAVREILAESASEDSFWAVRRASLESRAGEVDPNLSGFLIDRCRDTNSKVRTAAVRALGNLKSRDIIPFLIDLFEKDTSYLVQSEILRALGKCGDERDLPFLRKAAGIPSHRNILLRSAEAAIRSIENPRVLIKTELGDITVEIFEPKAPITAANFLKYVDSGRYDGSVFHRTVTLDNQPNDKVRIEVIQGGMLPRDKSFGPIPHESTEKTGIKHVNGAISMARSRPGSATSSFFFCINNQPELDFGGMRNPDGQGFAAFGRVIAGMDVVRRIHGRPAEGQSLNPSVKIISIERIGR